MNKTGTILLEMLIAMWLALFVTEQVVIIHRTAVRVVSSAVEKYSGIYSAKSDLLRVFSTGEMSDSLHSTQITDNLVRYEHPSTGLWIIKYEQ